MQIVHSSLVTAPDDLDPYAPTRPGAPVSIYATGVRNAYDLVFHSNGHLYAPVNGSASGGATPASPDGLVPGIPIVTTPETLRLRRWGAFLHDLGKPAVRHVKANGEWGFYRHETVGAELAGVLLERLRVSRQDLHAITHLVRRHMDRPDAKDARSVRRYMSKAAGHWRDLVALKRADNASHTYDDAEYHDRLEAACERIEREEAERLRAESPLTGDDLVAMFDRAPGPWIRVVKERLSAMVLDGELAPSDRAAAERVARGLMRGR
jgi:poly(A) polymerase